MPKKLNLDQCSVSIMCADAATPRRETKLCGSIAGLVAEGTVEVWTSPDNVMEISLCADFDEQNRVLDTAKLDLRVRLAAVLVELTDCRLKCAPGTGPLGSRRYGTTNMSNQPRQSAGIRCSWGLICA
jgi:hypothetical protein